MANPGPSPLRRLGVLGATGTLATGSVAALLTALAVTPAAAATTYTVDDASDGTANSSDCTTPVANSCSLRDAVAAADDGDTIVFAPGITSITLTEGTLTTDAVSILGPGSAALTITTTAAAGLYDTFKILHTGDVTLSGFTLTKNRIKATNTGDFTLDDVIVEDSAGGYGGALYLGNTGDASIMNSHFSRNSATDDGGAVYIYNQGAATISDSTFTDNSADGDGGAMKVSDTLAADFVMQRSSVTGNSAGAQGGGLYIGNGGSANIQNSTIADNTAVSGGAIMMSNDFLTIANSTITGNSASDSGGALYNYGGTIYLLQSTITQNTAGVGGGGLYLEGSTGLFLSGTILSGNTSGALTSGVAAGIPDDIYAQSGSSLYSDHSIVGAITSDPANMTIIDAGGTIRSDDPGVAPLADNGGPTMTMALLATSPAIDAGPDPVAPFPGNDYDQRGPGYARVVFGRADIGAYEVQEPTPEPEPEPVIPAFTG